MFKSPLLVAILLCIFWLMAISATIQKSSTFDEIAHLTGGYSYLRTGDYRIHPENGPLPQKWAALPLLFADVKFPTLHQPDWWRSDVWRIGFQFFYLNGNDADRMLFAGRSMIALLGVTLGLIVYGWSRKLFGPAAGLFSLLLFLFCPNMLAHAALVTSDMSSALFLILSVWTIWNFLHDPSVRNSFLTAGALTGLLLSKASSLLIFLVAIILLIVRIFYHRRSRLNWPRTALGGFLIMSIVFVSIWGFYSFRFSAFREFEPGRDQLLYSWQEVESHAGGKCFQFLREHHILPEPYLYGTSMILASRKFRMAFMNGEYSLTGWRSFFPFSFLVKTPIPILIIFLVAAIVLIRRRQSFYQTIPLLVFAGVYWIFAVISKVDIGHRYLLPIYPAFYILAGAAFAQPGARVREICLTLAVVWLAAESLWIRPHYLAYFNEFIGGPKNAYKHLVDSSLDWGQDLPGLSAWLKKNHSEPVFLSYFGTASPEYYGVEATPLHNADAVKGSVPELKAGIYCISATMLQCLYSVPVGPWAAEYEKTYQRLQKEVTAGNKDPNILNSFQRYRFARLCAYLRKRNYDDHVGYSILIYRLSDSEIKKAVAGPPAELVPNIQVKGLKDGQIPHFLQVD